MKRFFTLLAIASFSLSGCSSAAPQVEQVAQNSEDAIESTASPTDSPTLQPALYVETDPIDWEINPNYVEGGACSDREFGWQLLGFDKAGKPAFLKCNGANNGKFRVDPEMPKIDPETMKPLVPIDVPTLTLFGYSPNIYIEPKIVSDSPSTPLTEADFDSYEKCKIAEVNDGSVDKSYGFPLPSSRVELKDGLRILVVPVQFDDHPTSGNPRSDMADVIDALSKFYSRASSEPLNFEWTVPDSYYSLNRTIESFDLSGWEWSQPGGFYNKYEPYLEAALAAADADYDYSNFDIVIVEEPRSVTNAEHPMFVPHAQENGGVRIDTQDGPVRSILVTGNDSYRNIPNWIHEFAHLLGLGDRNWNTDSKPGFDLMFGWYGAPELSVWNRWLLGVLKDAQVDCKTDTETSVHWMKPVAWVGDYKKGVVIPVSDHEVIVVESRRRQGFDALFGKESEGAYVYRIDTSARMYQPDDKVIVDVIAPSRSKPKGSWALDASLKLGESVTSDGWTIKVVETGAFGDVVQVSKD